MTEIHQLPEGCIADILSRTTPVDACRLSLISKTFQSAADSDAVWNRFLPSDSNFISSIISHSPSLANASSKKALYLALSDPHKPIIFDQGRKSFQLDRKSAKKCYMLGARALNIVWTCTKRYWQWIAMPQSRFPEVAELLNVCWLEIRGKINAVALSPNTQYTAYLVFNMIGDWGFQNLPVEVTIDGARSYSSSKLVCLDPNVEGRPHNRVIGLQRPSVRSDGWLEIEMGEFFSSGLEDDEVRMSVVEIKGQNWKRGLFVEGIEVRLKEDN
ncbi:F-box protein PP2 [Cicer arietinum]|uniref:F-box protein PP2 n=1 Tax=Cicer arietinum TaxID=3827 RepID=A0A059PC27_CICAR|nr:F-box protein PP2 [Cicer arietinum]AGH13618.1 F-box protein PP2 [Cicer arietinum]